MWQALGRGQRRSHVFSILQVSFNSFVIFLPTIFIHFLDKFSEMLATAVKNQLVSGDGFDPAVNQGPLINEQQFQKVDGIVRDAVSKGARLVSGGGIHPTLKGRFYQPTVLANITENMKIYSEEIFGPVCPLYK